jgi:hypothetical protein
MHIHDILQSEHFNEIDSPASNISAASIAAFTTSLCYAKITPAALQRDIFRRRGQQAREALGRLSKFAFGGSVGATAATSPSLVARSPMACC